MQVIINHSPPLLVYVIYQVPPLTLVNTLANKVGTVKTFVRVAPLISPQNMSLPLFEIDMQKVRFVQINLSYKWLL